MSDVTRILSKIQSGDQAGADELLPLVYDELRKLAHAKIALENSNQTLQATALVHEAYLRLLGEDAKGWDSRGHFFAAAAIAMRRILVESARRKKRIKHGGEMTRQEFIDVEMAIPESSDNLLALDEALDKLELQDPDAARLVQLRYFAGLSIQDAATAMGLSVRTTERLWTYAKSWLHQAISASTT